MLPAEQQAWLRFAYSNEHNFHHQQIICHHAWNLFENIEPKLSKKVKGRMVGLLWLAIQVTAGKASNVYTASLLSKLLGVKPDNWSKHYAIRWRNLLFLIKGIDKHALTKILELIDKNLP